MDEPPVKSARVVYDLDSDTDVDVEFDVPVIIPAPSVVVPSPPVVVPSAVVSPRGVRLGPPPVVVPPSVYPVVGQTRNESHKLEVNKHTMYSIGR